MRSVNHISGFQGSYEEKLKELGLESLEIRWERFDLMQTFNILNGIVDMDSEIWFRQVDNEDYRLQGTHLITETLFPLDQKQTKEIIFSQTE